MKIQIEAKVLFSSPFNIGTGAMADSPADKPTFKDGRNRPIIPGSAFKGRLRHTCEQLVRALTDDDHAACLSPSPSATCPLDPHHLGEFCPICKLFGSPHRPGPLVFSDLHWDMNQVDMPPTAVRTGVSIGRRRRVAEPGRLYEVETSAPLPIIPYKGYIHGHLVDKDFQKLIALLWAGLRDLQSLGGGRGRGLGRCRLEAVISTGAQPVDMDWLKEGLRQWLA